MSESPFTRHRVVVTMTRGDETARRFGNPLQFENLGGVVVACLARQGAVGKAPRGASADDWDDGRLRRTRAAARATMRAPR